MAMEKTDEVEMQGSGPGTFKRNLFPFALPLIVHEKILAQVARGSSLSHLILMTRTAHPGLCVAARGLNLECIVLIQGNKEHCLAHGRELLRKMLVVNKYTSAK